MGQPTGNILYSLYVIIVAYQTNRLSPSVFLDFKQNVCAFENQNKKYSSGKLCNSVVLVLSCRQASHMLGRHCWMELISVSIRGGLWVEICRLCPLED